MSWQQHTGQVHVKITAAKIPDTWRWCRVFYSQQISANITSFSDVEYSVRGLCHSWVSAVKNKRKSFTATLMDCKTCWSCKYLFRFKLGLIILEELARAGYSRRECKRYLPPCQPSCRSYIPRTHECTLTAARGQLPCDLSLLQWCVSPHPKTSHAQLEHR